MIISHFPGGGGKIGDLPFNEIFQYSGNASFIDDGEGNWRVKFLSSGTLTVAQDVFVDIFAVGGGGNGASGRQYDTSITLYCSGGGGGGGYTKTERNKKLEKGKSYIVTVGAARGKSSLADADGVSLCEATGGANASGSSTVASNGGKGGSGGGPGGYSSGTIGVPGSNGADGTNTVHNSEITSAGGKGQGTTTREFEDENGDIYSGGGGCGFARSKAAVNGAEGGGGNGASKTTMAQNGGENTGGGGGGGGSYNTGTTVTGDVRSAGKGGSGIVIIRNFRATVA